MRLASSYAQNSNCSWEPGQLDFERSVARYLSSRRHLRLLDYSKWIDGLNAILGPDNVCPLLLEEARTLDFWRQLSKFCHLKKFEPSNMVHEDGGNENVRRRAENSWAIQPLDTIFRARSTTEKYLNLIWPAIIAPKARMRCVDWSVQTLDARYKRKANRMDTARRESEIELSRKVMETIRDACGPANDRLGEQLGRNLKPLGY